jgi:uncharacterized protein (DUF1501 family)
MLNRREFVAGLSLGGIMPSFLARALAQPSRRKDTILVVVQMSGGNDGLNTIVPFADDVYRKLRPKLAIRDVLKIDDSVGFHPSLRGMAKLLEDGRLAIVQGVGYPDPNRSHFESMDIWHTCCRKGKEPRTEGWLGKALERADGSALHLGGEPQPLALAALKGRAASARSLEGFKLQPPRETAEALSSADRPSDNELLKFVQGNTARALEVSERVEKALKEYKTPVAYPGSDLAQKLRGVAQLIDADFGARVYYVAIDGFDTHSQQAGAHAALLGQLGDALAAFVGDLAHHGHADRVLAMSFSEFGRRVEENASEGTDHGTAGPMFVAGGRVKAGAVTRHPSLSDLVDGDLKHGTDFRQVYATVLDGWMGVEPAPVLGGTYAPLDLLKS